MTRVKTKSAYLKAVNALIIPCIHMCITLLSNFNWMMIFLKCYKQTVSTPDCSRTKKWVHCSILIGRIHVDFEGFSKRTLGEERNFLHSHPCKYFISFRSYNASTRCSKHFLPHRFLWKFGTLKIRQKSRVTVSNPDFCMLSYYVMVQFFTNFEEILNTPQHAL